MSEGNDEVVQEEYVPTDAELAMLDDGEQPQPEPGYDESYDSAGMPQRIRSNLLIHPAYERLAMVYRPSWSDDDSQSVTVFRPTPCRSFSAPKTEFVPYRLDPGGRNHYGYWRKTVWMASNIGNPGISFIVHDPANGPYDPAKCPLSILNNAIQFALKLAKKKASEWQIKAQPRRSFEPDRDTIDHWEQLAPAQDNRHAQWRGVHMATLMQGIMYVRGSKITYADGRAPVGFRPNPVCVFQCGQDLTKKLNAICNEQVEGYRGAPGDFENRYVHGDLVDPSKGRLLVIAPKGQLPNLYASDGRSDPLSVDPLAGQAAAAGGEKDAGFGYDMYALKNYGQIPAAIHETYHQSIRSRWIHWDKLLWVPDIKQQTGLLASRLPPEVVEYAFFGEHTDWLPEDFISKIRERVSVLMVPQVPQPQQQLSRPSTNLPFMQPNVPQIPQQQPVQPPVPGFTTWPQTGHQNPAPLGAFEQPRAQVTPPTPPPAPQQGAWNPPPTVADPAGPRPQTSMPSVSIMQGTPPITVEATSVPFQMPPVQQPVQQQPAPKQQAAVPPTPPPTPAPQQTPQDNQPGVTQGASVLTRMQNSVRNRLPKA